MALGGGLLRLSLLLQKGKYQGIHLKHGELTIFVIATGNII